jgi:hypothetical protein
VHGLVAEILEQPEAAHLLAGQIRKAAGEDQIGQGGVAIGPLQLGVVVVSPLHQQLDRAAGVEAGGARVAEGELLHPHGLLLQLRPLAGDEGVLGAHRPGNCAITNANQSGGNAHQARGWTWQSALSKDSIHRLHQ